MFALLLIATLHVDRRKLDHTSAQCCLQTSFHAKTKQKCLVLKLQSEFCIHFFCGRGCYQISFDVITTWFNLTIGW